MFYIHETACISPQHTFGETDLSSVKEYTNNELNALEPKYESIPPGLLRRMGKAVRIGVGTGLHLLQHNQVNGIVVGTSNGGLEDCVKFLIQIIEYEEGRLTPTNFVQSTPNAIAAQLGLMASNKGYNITHTHRGLAFENAVLDVSMLLRENQDHSYLLGGIDEISSYNHAIEKLGGWFKEQTISNKDLYEHATKGSLAGEGAHMFIVNNKKEGAIAKLLAMKCLHTSSILEVEEQLGLFLQQALPVDKKIDLLISGENGDERHVYFYEKAEEIVDPTAGIIRFKHLTGEFPTASAFALWLGSYLFSAKNVPEHLYKRKTQTQNRLTLIYNHYKGEQHSFMLVANK